MAKPFLPLLNPLRVWWHEAAAAYYQRALATLINTRRGAGSEARHVAMCIVYHRDCIKELLSQL